MTLALTAKIIVVDPKPTFSKIALFKESWSDRYDSMIDCDDRDH